MIKIVFKHFDHFKNIIHHSNKFSFCSQFSFVLISLRAERCRWQDSYKVGLQSCKLEVPPAVIYSFCLICQPSSQVGRWLWPGSSSRPGLLTGTTSVWSERWESHSHLVGLAGLRLTKSKHWTVAGLDSMLISDIWDSSKQQAESHSELPLNFPQVGPCRLCAGLCSTTIRHRESRETPNKDMRNQQQWMALMVFSVCSIISDIIWSLLAGLTRPTPGRLTDVLSVSRLYSLLYSLLCPGGAWFISHHARRSALFGFSCLVTLG